MAQDRIDQLLDSLVNETDDRKAIQLNLKIASELKYKDKSRATYYIKLAENKAQEINSDKVWKEFYPQATHIYLEMDAFDWALNYLLKEYNYYKNTDELKRYEIENQLGVINAKLNNPQKALFYFKEILNHYLNQGEYDLLSKTYNNIGLAFFSMQQADSSLIYFNKGLETLNKSPNPDIEIHLRTNLARCLAQLNKYDSAEKNYDLVSSLVTDKTNPSFTSWANTERAKFYLQTQNPDKAIEYALAAESIEPSKNSFVYSDILKVLYRAYYEKEDYKNAVYYYKLYDEVRDNLNIEEKAVNVEKLKIEYDYQIKEQQSEIENNRKRISHLITIGGLIILLLILSIFMIRYKNRLVKVKLENELKAMKENELKMVLELKNKELATKTIKETEQNELFNIVQKDLKEIQSKAIQSETKAALNQLVKKIKSNSLQNNWEEFELRFSHIYESFYDNLNALHPSLSPQDKRICALIKLNLTTKEISNITKSSIKSIENTRTRLRKKMGITNSKIDLAKYLSDL